MTSPFKSLINKFKNGDYSLLSDILKKYKAYCIAQLQLKFKCQFADAEDIFSDALLTFRKNVLGGKVKHDENLRGYVLRICVLSFLKKNQKNKKITTLEPDQLNESQLLENDCVNFDHLVFQEGLQHKTKEDKRKLQLIKNAFKTLPKKCQKIICLFIIRGKSLGEIAAMLGYTNADVVKTTKARCCKQLNEAIKNQPGYVALLLSQQQCEL